MAILARPRFAARLTAILGLFALGGGFLSFLGWCIAAPRLIDWDGNGISIKPNAALSATCAGAALLLFALSRSRRCHRAAIMLGVVIAVIGVATLFEHVSGVNLGIDTLLFDEPAGARATASPGRMGIPASAAFALWGLAIVFAAANARTRRWAVPFALVAMCIATFSMTAYLFGADPLYSTAGWTGIAIQTASMLFALSIGLLAALPDQNPVRLLQEDSAAGLLARRSLPFVFILPPLLGWLRGKGQELGYYDTATGRALLILTLMLALTALLWRAVAAVHSRERALSKANEAKNAVQQKLHESEARVAAMLASMSDGFHAVDGDLRFTYFNEAARRMYAEQGVDAASLLGRRLFEAFPDATALSGPQAIVRCLTERAPTAAETFYAAWDRWFSVRNHPTIDGGVATFFIDITKRKLDEAALLESQRNLAAELDAAARLQEVSTQLIQAEDVHALYDQILDTAVAFMGSQFASIQLLHADETHGGELELIGQRGFPPQAVQFWKRVVPASKSTCGVALVTGERVIVPDVALDAVMAGSDDLKTYLDSGIQAVQTTPLLSRDGRMLGMISTHWSRPHHPAARELGRLDVLARIAADLIERRQIEDELRDGDRRKDEFLATLAHELRNPLAPITNSLALMKLAGGDASVMEEARSTMERQLRQLARLVDDLLDLSRITRDKIELKRTRVELAPIIRHALEACRPMAEAISHEMEIAMPAEPIILDADPVRLTQIFGNILNNACKYTEHGGHIFLSVVREGSDAVVKVQDTGLGIARDMLPKVFEMFTQVDRTIERSQGGLGIGLSLVKRLVELHGGSVSAHSAGLGLGSEFVVRLPIVLTAKSAAVPQDGQEAPMAPRRVLVVDDNRDSATSLSRLFKINGSETLTAHDGVAAVETAAEFRPELILLDIGLPKMNGYDACRAIRNEPWGKGITMIALTGWGQDEDRRRSHDAGFDGHLVKPVEFSALTSLLAGLESKPS